MEYGEIVQYPHPALRWKTKSIKRVDVVLRTIVNEMFELMYKHDGAGLSATQINLPLRVFVTDVLGAFINPVLSRPKGRQKGEEGCLSLPDIVGFINRPKHIHINAFGLDGKEIDTDLSGLDARIVQHEVDHLNGMLFTDLMNPMGLKLDLEALEMEYRRRGGPTRAENREHMLRWEEVYC